MRTMMLLVFGLLPVMPVAAQEYMFQPGDYIDINVYNSEDLTGEFRILSDGGIRLPMVGRVPAEGLTERQLENTLRDVVGVYIKNPIITITPRYPVYVMGYVNTPGVYTVEDSQKIIEVIAQAGGFSPEASGMIDVYREKNRISIDKATILKDNSALSFVRPGDVVVAKRKFLTRSDYSIILSTLTAISLSVFYLSEH